MIIFGLVLCLAHVRLLHFIFVCSTRNTTRTCMHAQCYNDITCVSEKMIFPFSTLPFTENVPMKFFMIKIDKYLLLRNWFSTLAAFITKSWLLDLVYREICACILITLRTCYILVNYTSSFFHIKKPMTYFISFSLMSIIRVHWAGACKNANYILFCLIKNWENIFEEQYTIITFYNNGFSSVEYSKVKLETRCKIKNTRFFAIYSYVSLYRHRWAQRVCIITMQAFDLIWIRSKPNILEYDQEGSMRVFFHLLSKLSFQVPLCVHFNALFLLDLL